MNVKKDGQHPPSQGSGMPIEYVIEPHRGFRAKECIDKSHPYISLEWCYERNGSFGPEDFTYGSHVSVWWQCSENPKHSWLQSPKKRTRKKLTVVAHIAQY